MKYHYLVGASLLLVLVLGCGRAAPGIFKSLTVRSAGAASKAAGHIVTGAAGVEAAQATAASGARNAGQPARYWLNNQNTKRITGELMQEGFQLWLEHQQRERE
ncbi:MAG: hypothetical protein KatS3mg110_4338 [Pirellulaceae bacterium]|nr:MAG: hypothetical protein KatS3mg110_4338 [Pirellulaceae bacterium]